MLVQMMPPVVQTCTPVTVVAVLLPSKITTALPWDGGQMKVLSAAAFTNAGAQLFTTILGGEIVTVADALLVESATEVAVTVTVGGLGVVVGEV